MADMTERRNAMRKYTQGLKKQNDEKKKKKNSTTTTSRSYTNPDRDEENNLQGMTAEEKRRAMWDYVEQKKEERTGAQRTAAPAPVVPRVGNPQAGALAGGIAGVRGYYNNRMTSRPEPTKLGDSVIGRRVKIGEDTPESTERTKLAGMTMPVMNTADSVIRGGQLASRGALAQQNRTPVIDRSMNRSARQQVLEDKAANRQGVQREAEVSAPVGMMRPATGINTAGGAGFGGAIAARGPQYGPRATYDQMMRQMAEGRYKYDTATKERQESFTGWVNSLGDKYQKGERNVTPENVMPYLSETEQDRQRGAFDRSEDYRLHSTAQKAKDAAQVRQEAEEWQAWHDANAPKTAEEEQARKQRAEQLNESRATWINELGVNVSEYGDSSQNVHKRPEDYFDADKRDYYDQKLYDSLYGDGAWYERTESLQDDREVDELEQEMDAYWDMLEKHTLSELDRLDTGRQEELLKVMEAGQGVRDKNKEKAYAMEEEVRREELLKQMAENAPAAQAFDTATKNQGDSTDRAYFNINNGWTAWKKGHAGTWTEFQDEWFVSDTPMSNYGGRSERDIFNGYYQNGQKDEAMAFLQALKDSGVLAERRAKAQEFAQRESSRQEFMGVNIGGLAGVGATLVKPIANAIEGVDVLGSLFGIKGSGDNKSAWHALGNMVRNVRDERGNVWDEAAVAWFGQGAAGLGKKYNGALYSILDNMVAMGTAQGFTAGMDPEQALKATTGAVQWLMSTGAAADDFAQRTAGGMNPDEAAVYAIGNGIIEAITEKYSIEALLSPNVKDMLGNGRQLLSFLGKNVLAEGSEEVASDVLSMMLDDVMSAINGHETEFNQRISELRAMGMNPMEAKRQAMMETWQQFGESFYFGGLSGLVMSGGRVAMNAASNYMTGRKISSVNSVLQDNGAQELYKAADALGEGSQSKGLADVMRQEKAEGWNISKRRLGQLAQNIQFESQEQAQQVVTETVEKKAQEALEKGGENEDAAEELAPIVTKAVTEGMTALTKEERTALQESSVAQETVEEITAGGELTEEINTEIKKRTEDIGATVTRVSNLAEGRTAEGLEAKSVGEQLANDSDIRRADGARVEGSREVIVDNQFGSVEGMAQDENGEWKVEVKTGNETRLVDPSDVKATNFGTAAVLRQRAINPEFYSGRYTDLLMNQIDKGNVQNIGQLMAEAYKIRWAAYFGQAMPQTKISQQAAEDLYIASREDAAEEWQKAQDSRQENFKGQGKGVVRFGGAEYGTEEFNQKIKDLDELQKDRIDMVANIAQASGIELDFVDASDPEYRANVHGFESGKGITINLDSYDNRQAKEEGRKHHIVATLSHEMTHWLQRNNAKGYLQLQNFVLEKMADEGINLAARAEDMMAQRGIGMTEAIDEIVANACDQVLGNQQMAKELQQNNRGLYNSIRNFVRNIVDKIKSAVFGMEDSASLDARRMMYKYGNELAKVWLGAYDDVLTGKIQELDQQAAADDIKKMSQAELDDSYMDAIQEVKDSKTGLVSFENRNGDTMAEELPGGSVTMYSYSSWMEEDIEALTKKLVERGFGQKNVKKWIKDVNSIAAKIATDHSRWDYEAAPNSRMLKNNQEYIKTLDASTLCAKRLLYQGIFNEIQHMLPNTPLLPQDLIDLVNMMKKGGLVTPCGICYVESRRRMLGQYAQKWLDTYDGAYKPKIEEVTTTDGLDALRNAPEGSAKHQAYEDFVDAMNAKGSANPKVVQLRTDYKAGEIRNMTESQIKKVKEIGGLRVQSFSDFETPHLIDMMQAVLDMAAMDLTSQAYTKVPGFAWVFGDTGMKINLSLIGEGDGYTIDENGKYQLKFSDTEGMPIAEARALRKAYSKNVGTILVGMNDEHIVAAMGSDEIDFIIPFHKSGWSKREMSQVIGMSTYKDYTRYQNEKKIDKTQPKRNGQYKTIPNKKSKIENIHPVGPKDGMNGYWDFKKSGIENAEKYLALCKQDGRLPKFHNFLIDDGEGGYKLPTGTDERSQNIRKGYWKLLIDFKMYDNDGKGSPQESVQANFNMQKAYEIMDEYKGGANTLPTNHALAKQFVDQYKEAHPRNRYSMADDSNLEVASWMEHVSPWSLQTEGERKLLEDYRGKRVALQLSLHRQTEYSKQIQKLEAKGELEYAERQKLAELRNKLDVQEGKQTRLLNELYQITGSAGYGGMMYRNQKLLDDYVQGKTIEQVEAAADQMAAQAETAEKEIAQREKELQKMAESSAVQTIRKELNGRGLKRTADELRGQFRTDMGQGELEGRLAEIVLTEMNGGDTTELVQALAQDVAENIPGTGDDAASETLANLWGMTIQIGPAEQQQMKAMNLSLKDIRESTKGSGVTFKFVNDDKQSTLMQNTDEIRGMATGIAEELTGSDTDISTLANWISDQLTDRKSGASEYGIDTDELGLFIKTSADMMLDDQMGGLSRAELQAKITKQAGKIGTALEAVKGARGAAQAIRQTGRKLMTNTNALHGDIAAALDYYNMAAKQAAEIERNNVRKNVIEVLRSEHTRDLIQQEQKFKKLINENRRARELHDDNEHERKQITTVARRFRTLLTAETDKKNIQEEAKPLARMVAGMLADHDGLGLRKVLFSDKKTLDDFRYRLFKMEQAEGKFDADRDLDWLVIKTPNPEDYDYSLKEKVEKDLADIEKGLQEYQLAEGNGLQTLDDRNKALTKIQEAVSEIGEMIQARSEAFIEGKKWQVFELAEQMQADMKNSRFKGERTGKLGKAADTIGNYVGYGNLTPEYFIKNLRNRTMDLLMDGMHEAENNSGLQALKAQKTIDKIAKETGFEKWDGQEVHKVKVAGGTVDMTTEQIMALYATWIRESNGLRPEDTSHLLAGGFILAKNDRNKGLYGREKTQQRPIRMTEEKLDNLESYLTPEQLEYVNRIVDYMSGDLAELGNEASLRTYGIRKFTEKYYFPIKSWGGVLNSSSTSGVNNSNDNAAMRQSFSKRVQANASNAVEIGDFTATAMKHIVGMIRFNTIGPAVENMNKVLNQQLEYGKTIQDEDTGEEIDDTYKRNIKAAFQENYGEGAMKYLKQWMLDINGGVTAAKDDSLYGKLLGVFRKGAVAGSMSVAAQQPLSYIRAAMMVNPKYLAGSLAPWNYGRVHDEMLKYSGVAVIKDMGKFDMNQGRSMIDFISPESMQSRAKTTADWITEKATILPQKMDELTWGRMWKACKLETADRNPQMDQKSDEFMQKVARRFNDLMRKTQVYDSVMVRSQNMRSQNVANKMLTSFMAEPTLTLNVLADAVQNVKEKGGKLKLAKAVATYVLSAAAQAAVKGFMGSVRNPDKKKTLEEQFYIKWIQNFLSEANPLNLIPGYSDIVEAGMKGDVSNDAMGVIGKLKTISESAGEWMQGKSESNYRTFEDTIGQVTQIFTGVPLKNMMRDARAMVNWFTPKKFASRDSSGAVVKYGLNDAVLGGTNIAGFVNKLLQDAGAGYGTSTGDYAKRIYEAGKAGNEKARQEMTDYYVLAKSKADDPMKKQQEQLNKMAKDDDSLTVEEKLEKLDENGYKSGVKVVLENYRAGKIDRATAERLYREQNPNAQDKDIMKALDNKVYTGRLANGQKEYTNYTPLLVGLEDNSAEAIREATDHMLENGYTEKDIKKKVNEKIKAEYLEADSKGKVKLRDAMQKAYKSIGFTAEDADKTIESWNKKK